MNEVSLVVTRFSYAPIGGAFAAGDEVLVIGVEGKCSLETQSRKNHFEVLL